MADFLSIIVLLNFLNVKLRGIHFLIMLKIIHPCQVHIKEKIFMTFKGVCLVKLTKEEDGFGENATSIVD